MRLQCTACGNRTELAARLAPLEDRYPGCRRCGSSGPLWSESGSRWKTPDLKYLEAAVMGWDFAGAHGYAAAKTRLSGGEWESFRRGWLARVLGCGVAGGAMMNSQEEKTMSKFPGLADQMMGRCVHYTGCLNEGCRQGVNYRELADVAGKGRLGWVKRLPCIASHDTEAVCHWRSFLTREEAERKAAEEERWVAEFLGHVNPLAGKIKAEHKGEDWSGVVDCPKCSGRLHVSHAKYNGHVHGKCETEGCLSWME